jgi:hypothetical protein
MAKYKSMKMDPSHSQKRTGMKEPTHYVMTDHKDGKPPSRTLHYSADEAEAYVKTRKQVSPHKTATIFSVKRSGQDTAVLGSHNRPPAGAATEDPDSVSDVSASAPHMGMGNLNDPGASHLGESEAQMGSEFQMRRLEAQRRVPEGLDGR